MASTRPTLGDTLRRDRLEHRARRLREALDALEARRLYREARDGEPPPALLEAVAAFEAELASVTRRLAQLSHRGQTPM